VPRGGADAANIIGLLGKMKTFLIQLETYVQKLDTAQFYFLISIDMHQD